MSADMVLVAACISTKYVQQNSRMHQCLSAVVPLHDADHFRRPFTLVLESADLNTRAETEYHFSMCIGKFLLYQLECGQGFVELVTLKGVSSSSLQTVFQCAHDAPADAVSRIVQAGKRRSKALAMGQ